MELVRCFQEAAKRLGIESDIVAGDCDNTAPALYLADKSYLLPRIEDPEYIDAIVEVCNQEGVVLIVPTIDPDLLLLAKNKNFLESETGAKVLISDMRVTEICRDKYITQQFLEQNSFGVPKMYRWEDTDNSELYPLFIKPRSGSSSVNTFKVFDLDELMAYKKAIDGLIIQEYIEGDEYTVDVFLDFESNVITIVPRLRIATRGGEISKGKIVKDRAIIEDVHRLMKVLRPVGQITVQLMRTENGLRYTEINPRFGGGAPMSIQSGADSCENIYRLLMNQRLDYNEDYRSGITFLRFDSSVCLNEDLEIL